MTFIDHTAPARLSVRNEPESQSFPYTDLQLYPLSPAEEKQLTDEHRRLGSLFAITVVEGLLKYNEAYKRHFGGKHHPTSPLPLMPSQVSGLHAALYHLQQYLGTLHPEPGG